MVRFYVKEGPTANIQEMRTRFLGYGIIGVYASNAGAEESRRKRYFQQDGQMIRHAAGVAGAGVGAEGFLAGVDGVAGQ